LPRPQPVTTPGLPQKKHLELPKNEIQAMTTDENDFDLQSPIECCTNARVERWHAKILAAKARVSTFGGRIAARSSECAIQNRSI
jgi:hypothetical protein